MAHKLQLSEPWVNAHSLSQATSWSTQGIDNVRRIRCRGFWRRRPGCTRSRRTLPRGTGPSVRAGPFLLLEAGTRVEPADAIGHLQDRKRAELYARHSHWDDPPQDERHHRHLKQHARLASDISCGRDKGGSWFLCAEWRHDVRVYTNLRRSPPAPRCRRRGSPFGSAESSLACAACNGFLPHAQSGITDLQSRPHCAWPRSSCSRRRMNCSDCMKYAARDSATKWYGRRNSSSTGISKGASNLRVLRRRYRVRIYRALPATGDVPVP